MRGTAFAATVFSAAARGALRSSRSRYMRTKAGMCVYCAMEAENRASAGGGVIPQVKFSMGNARAVSAKALTRRHLLCSCVSLGSKLQSILQKNSDIKRMLRSQSSFRAAAGRRDCVGKEALPTISARYCSEFVMSLTIRRQIRLVHLRVLRQLLTGLEFVIRPAACG